MEQIVVAAPSPLAGQSLVEANLRQRFGVIVVGIQRADGKMEFNPSPDAGMQPGDQLVVLGRPESLKELGLAAGPERGLRERTDSGWGGAGGHASRGTAAPGRGVHRPDGRPPGLGIVLVGTHAPSEIYVRNKLKAASDIGCRADLVRLPETATLAEVVERRSRAERRARFTMRILVQDPLPAQIGGSQAVFDVIDPAKDVDGFTPVNAGLLVQNRATLVPCTPSGRHRAAGAVGIAIAGRHAVVIGRSDIVGKPMALLLLHRDATVTICHSRTRGSAVDDAAGRHLVAAVGRTAFVRPNYVKPGATVIDVGINRVTDRVRGRGALSRELATARRLRQAGRGFGRRRAS